MCFTVSGTRPRSETVTVPDSSNTATNHEVPSQPPRVPDKGIPKDWSRLSERSNLKVTAFLLRGLRCTNLYKTFRFCESIIKKRKSGKPSPELWKSLSGGWLVTVATALVAPMKLSYAELRIISIH